MPVLLIDGGGVGRYGLIAISQQSIARRLPNVQRKGD